MISSEDILQKSMDKIAGMISNKQGIALASIKFTNTKFKDGDLKMHYSVRRCYPNILNDRTVSYMYVEPELKIVEKKSKAVNLEVDFIDAKVEEQVHKFFPFSSCKSESFKVPNWTKSLLYENYTLMKIKEVVKYFNTFGSPESYLPFKERINFLIIDDLEIQSY